MQAAGCYYLRLSGSESIFFDVESSRRIIHTMNAIVAMISTYGTRAEMMLRISIYTGQSL